MSERIVVLSIIEGHGEVESIGILLRRVWLELVGGVYMDTPKPIRVPRGRLTKRRGLENALKLARKKLRQRTNLRSAVMVLVDGDGESPCTLGPELQTMVDTVRGDEDAFCIIANPEYETWFVAAAESLKDALILPEGEGYPMDPEAERLKKAWVESHFHDRVHGYSPTIHQPRLTAKMDLALCRRRSPSFDKLCRELEKRHVGE